MLSLELQRYKIKGVAEFAKEMGEKGLGKPKVSLQFELSTSGITELVKAEAVVEETYTVEEEVEVDDDEAAAENKTELSDTSENEERKTEESPEVSEEQTEGGEESTEQKKKEAKKEKTTKIISKVGEHI